MEFHRYAYHECIIAMETKTFFPGKAMAPLAESALSLSLLRNSMRGVSLASRALSAISTRSSIRSCTA